MAVASLLLAAIAATGQQAPDMPDMRCGAYCLYISLKAIGAPVASFADVEAKLGPPGASGYSLAHLAETAKQFGAHVLGVRATPESLASRSRPFACIALFKNNHFVNIGEVASGTAMIIDPPNQFEMPVDTLRAGWDGNALLLARAPLSREEDLQRGYLSYVVALAMALLGFVGAGLWLRRSHGGAKC